MPSLRVIVLLLLGSVILSTAAGGALGWALASSSATSSSGAPQSPAGQQGQPGDAGAAGVQGATGPQGPAGAAGAAGQRGATGPQGATGAQGATGGQGAAGANGAPGAQGAAGPQGASAPAVSTTSTSGVLSYTGQIGEYAGESLPGTFAPGTYVVGYSFRIHTETQSENIQCQLVDAGGNKYVQSAAQYVDSTPWYSFSATGVIVLANATTLQLTCNETTPGAYVDIGHYEDQALFAITLP